MEEQKAHCFKFRCKMNSRPFDVYVWRPSLDVAVSAFEEVYPNADKVDEVYRRENGSWVQEI